MHVCVLGAGSLSLGLICPWLAEIPHVELSLITRGGPSIDALVNHGGYRLGRAGERYELDAVFPQGVLSYDPDDLDDESGAACLAHLRDVDVAIISVGVPNLRRVSRLIARACEDADDRPPLHLLAFENSPDASMELRDEVARRTRESAATEGSRQIVAHRAIPDRACSRSIVDDQVVIHVERFSEIVLESTAGEVFRAASRPVENGPRVHLVKPALVPLAEMRKFWLVNGTHTALGLLCYANNRHLLVEALREPEIRQIMETLHGEWIRVLYRTAQEIETFGRENELFSEESLAAHAAKLFGRLEDLPNFSVLHVLKELGELETASTRFEPMLRLVEKLDDRLGHQVRLAQESGGIPVPTSASVLASGLHSVRDHASHYWSH
jgi:hypothetical protein